MPNKQKTLLNKRNLTGQAALIRRKYQRLFSVTVFALFVLLIILGFWGSTMAAEYHVATIGDDIVGDGSLGNPWQSPEFASKQLKGGDILQIHSGTYYRVKSDISDQIF